MENDDPHFWYAVSNTDIKLMPSQTLETFGSTIIHYHMISELMDTVNRVRIREGRVTAERPLVITPDYMQENTADFGEEAREYLAWLRDHMKDVLFLQYGFVFNKQEISEHVVTGGMQEVAERVEREVKLADKPMSAVFTGVDDPWEVCLLKLMVDVSRRSAPGTIRDLQSRNLLDDGSGVSPVARNAVEGLLESASADPSLIPSLADQLQKYGLFDEYEDRFFDLVRRHGR